MIETAITLFVSVLTALGGFEAIKYLLNRKAEKKKTEAEAESAGTAATKEVQDVYQQLIADVRSDREEQRAYITELTESRKHLREECEELRQGIDDTEKLVRDLQKEVARNARAMESMRPFICSVLGCKKRQPVAISDEEVAEDIEPISGKDL
jgi:peptidoglycan hydrolase CwlO-like protein